MSQQEQKSIWALLPYDPFTSIRSFEGIEAGLIQNHPELFCRPLFQFGGKVESFLKGSYLGLIGLVPMPPLIDRIHAWGKPTINISSRTEHVPFPSVRNDEEAMGRRAAEHRIRS